MRRRGIIIILLLLGLGIGIIAFRSWDGLQTTDVAERSVLGVVSLRVDFGDAVKDWEALPLVRGNTAFDILQTTGLPIVYDPSTGAGVFIRQIGDKKNGDRGRYWQYWINDTYAMVAADRSILARNDRVVWKFSNDVPTDN